MTAELFRIDALARFVGLFVAVFTVLVVLYSLGYNRGRRYGFRYYLYLFLTFLCGEALVFADNLLLFICLWGFLGLLLFLLIGIERTEAAAAAAKKAFILIGATDALMLLGFALWLQGRPEMRFWEAELSGFRMSADGGAGVITFLCFLAAALAKAGAMPIHSWVPDTAQTAPIPVTAYLPASLDKLFGIYFTARLLLEMFALPPWIFTLLMAVGSFTIVAAVAMALIQHDLRRLLGYHAVSQVGYMVLGLGTGTLVGAAGGLFHMLNHAIYKSCLFLCGGAVEKQAGTSELDRLGGLAGRMPWTFGTFLVAALAISGIPPLNGFASKWLVYQGVLAAGKSGQESWFLWLAAAMFGTALTLASFMKLAHAVFLGRSGLSDTRLAKVQEVGWSMRGPALVLAALCVLFGIFAAAGPLAWWIEPALPGEVSLIGVWSPGSATLLLAAAVVVGFLIYAWTAFPRLREVEPFVGGEYLRDYPEMRISGVDFYRTVQRLPLVSRIYGWAEQGWFDLYELGRRGVLAVSRGLGVLHSGLLPRYVSWCLAGVLLLLLYFRSAP
ncbi:MAG: hypothetical protein Kow00109_05020 [Acidobacteriota bacterium]